MEGLWNHWANESKADGTLPLNFISLVNNMEPNWTEFMNMEHMKSWRDKKNTQSIMHLCDEIWTLDLGR
jgi:hypothetical protein